MSLNWDIRNCTPPQIQEGEQNKHYVVCLLCLLAGVGEITEENKIEVFERIRAIEEIQGASLMTPDGNVYLTLTDIERWAGMKLNVVSMGKREFKAWLRRMQSKRKEPTRQFTRRPHEN